jgi:hypothetical protein
MSHNKQRSRPLQAQPLPLSDSQPLQPKSAIEVFYDLIREAANSEIIEPALRDRGRLWFDAFKLEHPSWATALETLAHRAPEQVLKLLIANNPKLDFLEGNANAVELIRLIQKGERKR